MDNRLWTGFMLVALTSGSLAAQSAGDEASYPLTFESDGMTVVVERVATDLSLPSGMAFLSNRRALVAERGSGQLSVVDLESGHARPISGLPEVAIAGDGGILDVQLHPEYPTSGWIYFSYATRPIPGDSSTSWSIARAQLDGTRLVQLQTLLEDPEVHPERAHFGARMALSQGYLFVSVGDRRARSGPQRLSSLNGKILRLHEDGSVPADNPFTEVPGARPEIWSYGHRNPQGLALHPTTNELWSTEHGPQGGDEVNVIRPGRNYGWPIVSFGEEYGGGAIGSGAAEQPGVEIPRYYFRPSIAPGGADFYSGTAFPAWRGDLFIGALGLRHLNRLVVRDGRVLREERLLEGLNERVRFVRRGPDGVLYLGVDSGHLLRLRPA